MVGVVGTWMVEAVLVGCVAVEVVGAWVVEAVLVGLVVWRGYGDKTLGLDHVSSF